MAVNTRPGIRTYFRNYNNMAQVEVKRMRIVSSVVIAIVVGVSRLPAQNSGGMANMPGMNMPASNQPAGDRTAAVTGPMGSRGATGMASLTGSHLTIEWRGDQPGSNRGWALHRGSCGKDQGMIGAVSSYPPLTVDAHGNATAAAHLEAPLGKDTPYFVAVHAAATDSMSGMIACGGLAANAMNMNSMNMSALPMDSMPMGSMPTTKGMASDSMSAQMTAILMRMMSDPVIRERVKTDPTLMRMLGPMGMDSTMAMKMPGMSEMPGMSMSSPASSPKSGTTPKSSAPKATTTHHPAAEKPSSTPKTTAKSSNAKPATAEKKPATKKDSMPGMKMPPGTKMPPGMKMPAAKKDSMPGMKMLPGMKMP